MKNTPPVVNINVVIVTAPPKTTVNWVKAVGAVVLGAVAQLVKRWMDS